jgi:NAD(P)-dependent dehydrogenase (short-subunit alcohol dehydrogenase family)
MAAPIILITGATRGIGLAAAKQCVTRGAQVIVSSREAKRAEAAARTLGASASWVAMDLASAATIAAAVEQVSARVPRLDVLVNNAAVLLDHYEGLMSLDPATLRATLEANVIGTLRVTQAFVPLLQKSKGPRIVNVSSGAGQLDGEPQAWAPAYSISKTAVNMLTQQLTAALPEIAANAMCPGWCRTEMGGQEAPRSAEQGAETITWLALDAPQTLRGGFYKDGERIAW